MSDQNREMGGSQELKSIRKILESTVMRVPRILSRLSFGLCVVSGPALYGEGTNDKISPSAFGKETTEVRKKFSELSLKVNEQPEIQKLKSEMEAAQRAYMAAFEAAVAKEDPELMAKYRAQHEAAMNSLRGPDGKPERPVKPSSGYDQLSPEERKQLFAAREQAMQNSAVRDARQKRNGAKSEDERKAAESEYKAALRKAMVEADAKVEALLEKLEGKATPQKAGGQ